MGQAELLQALAPFNSHWKGEGVSELVRRNRAVRRSFNHMRTRVRQLPFEVMAGPRQVGKTTLMGHLMQSLVDEGVSRKRIAYALLDSPPVALELQGTLEPLVSALERFLLTRPLHDIDDVLYLFLDEIQTLPQWDVQLKGLYDRFSPHLRVLATGSSSAALVNPPTADFAGRVARSRLYPLKFSETLELSAPETASLTESARRLRQRVDWRLPRESLRAQLAESFSELYAEAMGFRGQIGPAFDRYLVRGGYPGAQVPATQEQIYRFFETGIDTILAKDLRTYDGIRKPASYRAFLTRTARDHSGKLVAARLARDVGVDATTIPQWVDVGLDLFLLERLHAVGPSLIALPRKSEKLYVQDPGVLSYLTGETELVSLAQSGRIGDRLEGVVLDHTKRLQFNAFKGKSAAIGYWESPEVDIVAELPHLILAIEVKKSGKKGAARLAALREDQLDILAIVVTDDDIDLDGDVWKLPAWLWCLTA